MGIFQSCLARNNKVGVMGKEEAEEYEKVIRTMVTEEVTEKKGGVAFGLSFISEEGTPKPVPSRLVCGDKEEDFEKWRSKHHNTCTYIFFLFIRYRVCNYKSFFLFLLVQKIRQRHRQTSRSRRNSEERNLLYRRKLKMLTKRWRDLKNM